MSLISLRKTSASLTKDGKAKVTVHAPVIDFPHEGEKIFFGHYAIRIGSSAGPVELSIDAGPWHRCRFSVGYHWYDWSVHAKGSRKIVARIVSPDGKGVKSKPRSCQVV